MHATAQTGSNWRLSALLAAIFVFALASGASAKTWMGVQVGAVPAEVAEANGLPPGIGVHVIDVSPDSPAAQSGVEPGDVVIEIDGQLQFGPAHLQQLVAARSASETVWVGLVRQGEIMSGPVTLDEAPESAGPQAVQLSSSKASPSDPFRRDWY